MKIKTKFNIDLLKGLKRKKTKKIILLHSAGVDSTATGILLKNRGFQIYPLFINYGQSALEVEKYLVKKSQAILGFQKPYMIKTSLLRQLAKSKLLGGRSVDDKDAWVPGRNTLFMIIAGIYAKQINADGISIGYMLEDNFVFGDNDFFHHKNIEEVLSKSFLQPMSVFLPIMHLAKKDLIQFLKERDVLEMTVSCWNPKLKKKQVAVCHKCANCIEREKYIKELT